MPIVHAQSIPRPQNLQRVLLINSLVYDTRFHWSDKHLPANLLKIGSFYRQQRAEVRYINPVERQGRMVLRKRRVKLIQMDAETEPISVPKWRFGALKTEILGKLREFRNSGWTPDCVFVEGFATFWWEGTAEVIGLAKQIFPDTPITLVGGYPSVAPDHAERRSGADDSVVGLWEDVRSQPLDLSLLPLNTSIYFLDTNGGTRPEATIIAEYEQAANAGVRRFAFMEHGLADVYPDLFSTLLTEISERTRATTFAALGNISPQAIAEQPGLADLLRSSRFTEIVFSDDREFHGDDARRHQELEYYRAAVGRLHAAGYKPRSGCISASVSIIGPNEDVEATSRYITLASHYAGSVILWPYQPSADQCPGIPLEDQNGKLFPLRGRHGLSYRQCLELLSLGTVLNSKYRDCTFDFLGDSLTARLFRESLERRGWLPDPMVKGSLQLPVRNR